MSLQNWKYSPPLNFYLLVCKCEQLAINSDCCIEIFHFWGPEGSMNNFIMWMLQYKKGRFLYQTDENQVTDRASLVTYPKRRAGQQWYRAWWFGLWSPHSVTHRSAALWPHIGSYRVRANEDICQQSEKHMRSKPRASGVQDVPVAVHKARASLCPAGTVVPPRAGRGWVPASCEVGARCTWPCQQHPAGGLILCQPCTPTVVAQQFVTQRWSSCPSESTLGWFPRALPRWVLSPPEQRGWSLGIAQEHHQTPGVGVTAALVFSFLPSVATPHLNNRHLLHENISPA